jgi:hypothetical protein
MKDDRGLYYYPFPQNKRVRMYVRQMLNEPAFRMWNQDDPEMWEQHGWMPHCAIVQAKSIYKGGPFDPDKAYDIEAAKMLIDEAG